MLDENGRCPACDAREEKTREEKLLEAARAVGWVPVAEFAEERAARIHREEELILARFGAVD
jgi:hypothetical protein